MQKVIIKTIIFSLLLTVLPTPRIVHAATISRPPSNLGLVGYWPMDEGKGNKAGDASGNGNNGTLGGQQGLPTWVNGKYGKALKFNGDPDGNGNLRGTYVEVSDVAILHPSSFITVSAWIKKDIGTAGTVVRNSSDYFLDFAYGATSLRFGINATWSPTFNGYPDDGKWHLVLGVYDGSNLYAYVDGKLLGSSERTGSITNTGVGVHIGARNDFHADYFSGLIDDVRIYNRALSATEISRMYSSGQTISKKVSEQGLVGYWSFNEGQGNKAGDSSGMGNNGTIVGATWAKGKKGWALDFPGTGNPRVEVPSNSALDFGTGSFTISGWGFHRDYTYPKSNFMIQKSIQCFTSSASNAGFDIGHGYKSNGLDICLRDDLNNSIRSTLIFDDGFMPSQLLNKWVHYSIIFDRTNNKVRAYVNGVQQTNELNISTVTGSINSSQSLKIGTMYGWQTDGILDDIRIYNRALSATEIVNLYKQNETMVNAPQNDKLTNGLVGLWSFNGKDVSGSTAYDRSGQGNHGTITGATLDAGKVGQGMNFSGTNQYIIINDSDSLDATKVTMSAWVKGNSWGGSGDRRGVIIKGTYYLTIVPTGKIEVYAYGKSSQGYHGSNAVLETGRWYHIACTIDETGFRIYIDGQLDKFVPATGDITVSANNLAIGSEWNGLNRYFNGIIDEARVYNRALSPEEIKQLYNMGK